MELTITKGRGYVSAEKNNQLCKNLFQGLAAQVADLHHILGGAVAKLLYGIAKEVRKLAEGLIALAVKEKDNYETVTVTAKVPRKDKDGKRVKEVIFTILV